MIIPKNQFNQRNQNILEIIYDKNVSGKSKLQTGRVGWPWVFLMFSAVTLVFISGRLSLGRDHEAQAEQDLR
jgi:hypothetical protein